MPTDSHSAVPPVPPVLISLPDGLSVSGVTLWAVNLARILAGEGRGVALVMHAEPPGQARLGVELPPGVEVVDATDLPALRSAAGDLGPFIVRYRDALRALARRHGGPVLYLPTLLGDSFAIGAALAVVDPELVRMVGWQHADTAYDRQLLVHYEPAVASFAGVSEAITAGIASALPHRRADVHHVPNAVAVGHAPPERSPGVGRPLRLVYTGRLEHKQKRVGALIALSDELARRGIVHTISLLGDGPADAEVRELAGRPDRVSRVLVRGAVTPADVRVALREADCFVLASRYEGMSISMLEAMAEGCVPIVTGVASGASEVITDGLNGFLARVAPDADDASIARSLAGCVERYCGADVRSTAMEAWRRARDGFSLERFAGAAMRVLNAAAGSEDRTWPASRPCAFTGADAGGSGSGSVPPDGAKRMAAALERLTGRRVVLHGAGRHTLELAATLGCTGATIVAVTDDDPARWGTRLLGWPVVAPAEAAKLGATDAVISSWMHADEVYERRGVYELNGVRVHHLYRDAEQPRARPYSSASCSN